MKASESKRKLAKEGENKRKQTPPNRREPPWTTVNTVSRPVKNPVKTGMNRRVYRGPGESQNRKGWRRLLGCPGSPWAHLLPNDCLERQYITRVNWIKSLWCRVSPPIPLRFCILFPVLSRSFGLWRNACCCCVTHATAGTWPTSNSLKRDQIQIVSREKEK